MNPRAENLELHIEQLVLHGFAPEIAAHLGAVVQQELQRLLAGSGTASFGVSRELGVIDAGAFSVEPDAGAQQVGAALAQTIYARLQT